MPATDVKVSHGKDGKREEESLGWYGCLGFGLWVLVLVGMLGLVLVLLVWGGMLVGSARVRAWSCCWCLVLVCWC